MKKTFHFLVFLSLILSFSLASCVSSKKFAASEASVSRIDILPFNRGGAEKSARLTDEIKSMRVETPDEEQMSSIAQSLSKYVFEVNIGG